MKLRKTKRVFFVIICLLTLSKLALMGRGCMSFPDEFRYKQSYVALKALMSFDIKGMFTAIFSTYGRPGDPIVKLVPTALQAATASIFHLQQFEPLNSYALFLFNFVVYALMLFTLYRISFQLIKDELLSLLVVIMYSCMTNSYIYLRHTLPYDSSLLLFYYCIYRVLVLTETNSLSIKPVAGVGALAFFSYLVYPGYVPLCLLTGFLLVFNNFDLSVVRKRIYYAFVFGAAAVAIIIVTEVLSRWCGKSYIGTAIGLSQTITQGSFEESYTFIIKYLTQAEVITGFVLMMGLGGYVISLVTRKTINLKSLLLVTIAVVGLYLLYAYLGYFRHKAVFYGRLIHQYIPLLCVAAIAPLLLIRNERSRTAASYLLIIVFVAGYGISMREYLEVYYPRDIVWKEAKIYPYSAMSFVNEYDNRYAALTIPDSTELSQEKPTAAGRVKFINACFVFPIPEGDLEHIKPYVLQPDEKAACSLPHFLDLKAYQFEGLGIKDRDIIRQLHMRISVLK